MNPLNTPNSPISFELPTTFNQLTISLPADEHDYQNDSSIDAKPAIHTNSHYAPYPSVKTSAAPQQPRRRRKREAIEIPDELVSLYDPQEVKKIKNRIAAARLRERSQQKIRDLEAEVVALRERNAHLESLTANCGHCNDSTAMVEASTSTLSPPHSPKSVPGSPVPPVRSPSCIADGPAMTQHEVMSELDTDLLQQLLWQSEDMAVMQMQL